MYEYTSYSDGHSLRRPLRITPTCSATELRSFGLTTLTDVTGFSLLGLPHFGVDPTAHFGRPALLVSQRSLFLARVPVSGRSEVKEAGLPSLALGVRCCFGFGPLLARFLADLYPHRTRYCSAWVVLLCGFLFSPLTGSAWPVPGLRS